MSTGKDMSTKVFDALLSIDELKKVKKLDLRISGFIGLYLALSIDYVMSNGDPKNLLRKILSPEDQAKLVELRAEILKKVELEGFYNIWKELEQG